MNKKSYDKHAWLSPNGSYKSRPRWPWCQIAIGSMCCWLGLLGITAKPAMAATPVNVQTTDTTIVSTPIEQATLTQTAQQWGLAVTDFKHYQWLMQHTPSGHWYKNLDPAEVLALNAKTPDAMLRYAKVQARNMHARVTRELAFDHLYSQAYKTLYPAEKPIQSPTMGGSMNASLSSGAALQAGDHLWLFVDTNTPLGSFAYQHVLQAIERIPGTVLDIYFVGDNVTPAHIQQWASNVSIPRAMVNKQITLNYGNDRFHSLTKGHSVNLPFVGIVHHNHFQPISLSSIL